MKCPMCGFEGDIDLPYCLNCGFKLDIPTEQPLPNWRRLPGFRSRALWKMVIAVIIYLLVLLAIVLTSIGIFQ